MNAVISFFIILYAVQDFVQLEYIDVWYYRHVKKQERHIWMKY